jgi:hypothetical protein
MAASASSSFGRQFLVFAGFGVGFALAYSLVEAALGGRKQVIHHVNNIDCSNLQQQLAQCQANQGPDSSLCQSYQTKYQQCLQLKSNVQSNINRS